MEEKGHHKNRFTLFIDLPKLQEIALHSVALSLWNAYISRSKPSTDSTIPYYRDALQFLGLNQDYSYDLDEIVKCLNAPTSIEKLLKKPLNCIATETIKWLSTLFWMLEDFVHHSNCVWTVDGKIDYKRSAAKILSAENRLSNVQKFILMCEFCLEDEIVKFPLNSLPADFPENTNFPMVQSLLIQYWFYSLKNELHEVQRILEFQFSLFGEIASNCKTGRWTAFEYFWHKIGNINEKKLVATCVFEHLEFCRGFGDRLMSLLSWQHQRSLLFEDTSEILPKIFNYGDSVELCFWIWTHFGYLITNKIFMKFFESLFRGDKLREEKWIFWLDNAWDTTSNKRKIYTIQNLDHITLIFPTSTNYSPSHPAFQLQCKILSMLNADLRKKNMQCAVQYFNIIRIDFDSMNELMNLCLPNIDDQLEFKNLLIEDDLTKKDCVKLIKYENFDRLNLVLEFFLPTSDDVRMFKKKLLESNEAMKRVNFFYQIKRWNSLCKFIGEVYGEDEAMIVQTKKQFITMYLSNFLSTELDCTPDVGQIIQILESELTENELAALKRSLFQNFEIRLQTERNYEWYRFHLNEMYFRRFVKWCLGDDDQATMKFVDTVLNAVLDSLHQAFRTYLLRDLRPNEPLLFNLNQFLLWYLMSEDKVKEYKMSRVVLPSTLSIFHQCTGRRYYSRVVPGIVKWFFNNDEMAIREFEWKYV